MLSSYLWAPYYGLGDFVFGGAAIGLGFLALIRGRKKAVA